ncbi:MAG: hypothetical protein RIQ93_684 [Verrucomicrobiota bacterium]|jgi:hypothetical protein
MARPVDAILSISGEETLRRRRPSIRERSKTAAVRFAPPTNRASLITEENGIRLAQAEPQ